MTTRSRRRAATADPDKENTTPGSKRRPRRASFRGPARLSRRRMDSERVVQHHVQALKDTAEGDLKTFADLDASADVTLEASWVLEMLDQPEDVVTRMAALLAKLQQVSSGSTDSMEDGEEEDEDEDEEEGKDVSNANDGEDEDSDLRGVAEVLATDRFMQHDDDAVRLFTACNLAELFRIAAPKPPLSSRKLQKVAGLFIDQLAVIAAPRDPLSTFRFSLLEQLATVKTFVIYSDEVDTVAEIFACFYAASRDHQPLKYRQYLADILVSLLEETESLDQHILDAALAPLALKSHYSLPAIVLAEQVIAAASNVLQAAVCNFFNAALSHLRSSPTATSRTRSSPVHGLHATPSKSQFTLQSCTVDGDTSDSELISGIEDLVVAVNDVAPDMLIYVIPNFQDRIRCEELAMRWANVHLLARLFTTRIDMADSYPALFADFIARIRDTDPGVRAEVCVVAGKLMVSHPEHRSLLSSMLYDRAMDRDEHVRVASLAAIGVAADVADVELLEQLGSRLLDRKPSVRKEALRQVLVMYRNCVTDVSPLSTSLNSRASSSECTEDAKKPTKNDRNSDRAMAVQPAETVGAEADDEKDISMRLASLRRVSWLPNNLVRAHLKLRSAQDMSAADEVEQAIFERLLDWKNDDEAARTWRCYLLSCFLSNLDTSALLHMTALVAERSRVRVRLLELAHYRLQARSVRPDTGGVARRNASANTIPTFSKRLKSRAEASGLNISSGAGVVDNAELRSITEALAKCIPMRKFDTEDVSGLCSELGATLDLKVFEQIVVALDHSSLHADAVAAGQDAVSRVGSKSSLGAFLRSVLLPRCRAGVFSADHLIVSCAMALKEVHAAQEKARERLEASRDGGDDEEELGTISDVLCGTVRHLDIASHHAQEALKQSPTIVLDLVTCDDLDTEIQTPVLRCGLTMASLVDLELDKPQKRLLLRKMENLMTAEVHADVENGVILAKWATRAMIKLKSADAVSEPAWVSILTRLTLQLGAFTDAEPVVAAVTALGQLAKHAPRVFKQISLESFDFARALLCGSMNSKVHSAQEEMHPRKKRQSRRWSSRRSSLPSVGGTNTFTISEDITNHSFACMGQLARRTVKLLVHALHAVDPRGDEELPNVTDILVAVLMKKDGDVFGVCDSAREGGDAMVESFERMCAVVRLACGCAMLQLARRPEYFHKISPQAFVFAILTVQDEHPDVRISFAQRVYKSVMRKRLPFRWVISLALMALDPDQEAVDEAGSMLTKLITHRRHLVDRARSQGNTSVRQLLPETTIPELIWALANLPDAEVDALEDFKDSEKCLELLMDRLLDSNEYAGVLNEYLQSLAMAQDAGESVELGSGPRSERISALARIGTALLKKKQAGRRWNLVDHPGHVTLPRDLYRMVTTNVETSGVASAPSRLDIARQYDEDHGMGQMRAPKSAMLPEKATRSLSPGAPSVSTAAPSVTVGTPLSRGEKRGSKRHSDQLGEVSDDSGAETKSRPTEESTEQPDDEEEQERDIDEWAGKKEEHITERMVDTNDRKDKLEPQGVKLSLQEGFDGDASNKNSVAASPPAKRSRSLGKQPPMKDKTVAKTKAVRKTKISGNANEEVTHAVRRSKRNRHP